jgi:hypothetical protein
MRAAAGGGAPLKQYHGYMRPSQEGRREVSDVYKRRPISNLRPRQRPRGRLGRRRLAQRHTCAAAGRGSPPQLMFAGSARSMAFG